MREFYEYEESVMENIDFDLNRKDKYHFADENRGVWVENNYKTNLLIGYVDNGKELNVKNTNKYVGIKLNERLGDKFLDIEFGIVVNNKEGKTKYENACICLGRDGVSSFSIYDVGGISLTHTSQPVVYFIGSDDHFIIGNLKKNTRKTLPIIDFTTVGFVKEVCDAVKSIHNSKEWNEEIDSLLEVIKPVLVICADDIKKAWLKLVQIFLKRYQRSIDSYDSRIQKLQKERLHEIEEYDFYKRIADVLQNSEEKIDINRKK